MSTLFNIPVWFFETRPYRVTLASLGAIGFDGLIVVDEVTGLGDLTVCSGAILSGDLMVGGMILS